MDERIFVIVVFNLDQSPENDFYKICFFKNKPKMAYSRDLPKMARQQCIMD